MLKVHNTLSKKKEEFKPLNPPEVTFYQCGPTVYWIQHLGNMRAMVLADLIRRSLAYMGYEVKFARNYTDVGHLVSDEDEGEDKMAKTAKKEKLTPQEVAEKYIAQFDADIGALNCLPADYRPKATEYIEPMKKMIQGLLDKDFAYATELAIYFDVSKFKDYTKLSGRKLEQDQSQAGKGEVSDSKKKQSADFALWFFKAGAHANALQTWPYDFKLPDGSEVKGEGFPGWHLECSAMNLDLFGPTIDLHMGGIEHVSVHHTNEIAQSESFTGKPFVRYWLHNEHLTVNGGKMSKSEGTSYTLKDIIDKDIIDKGYDPLVLRYFFLGAHYRSKQNFTWEALKSSKVALEKLRTFILEKPKKEELKGKKITLDKRRSFLIDHYKKEFINNISEDFNIPGAMAVVWDIVKDEFLPFSDKKELILDFDKVLGLNLSQLEVEKIPEKIKTLAEARWQARAEKNWTESDKLRDELKKLGWEMEDGKDDYKLKKIN